MRSENIADALGVPEVVKAADVTCQAFPVQIEGELHDGRRFYFRYRFGRAGIGIGATDHDAVRDQRGDVEYGGEFSGDLDEGEELREVFGRAWAARAAR
ncbi:hypothetical protein F9L07_19830 [Pimelobacter simplex]|uniref:Uncharacterized protein n=1 Tax=Nocardioides simplex TaxID=2045 RepID=A0A7J5DVJ7_NOCSI|nr:hypothetical protein [Pimelobacter simplex]KAB2809292.1 hypothetical protein F9L07_19830 [Pimelobacter simplex]